jgi:hypothetical protein
MMNSEWGFGEREAVKRVKLGFSGVAVIPRC